MAAKVILFEKFLEIVGHAYEIELHNPIHAMNSGGMNVSVNNMVSMQVFYCLAKLPEDMQNLLVLELLLAEGLPLVHVFRSLEVEVEFPLRDSVVFEDLN